MDNSIKAIHHSEERYSSLTLIAYSKEQREQIRKVVAEKLAGVKEEIDVSESEVDDILETTIEFHDDYDKKSGVIYDKILKALNIDECS
jgi:hypothetical protein